MITRSVQGSVRSHYDRHDLETLFELQPRAAQKLLEMLPAVAVGNAHLVEREVLLGFLERVRATDDLTNLYEILRKEKTAATQRLPRSMVRRDRQELSLGSLPASIALSTGRLEVCFSSTEELAEALYMLARVLESSGDEFAACYEPIEPKPAGEDEIQRLFRDLEAMEAGRVREAQAG